MQTFFLFIILFLSGGILSAQVSDDFSDGDFTSSPAWTGDAAEFLVNASFQLQSNNTIADTSVLVTPYSVASLDNQEWQVRVKQTFAPSGSNYSRVYLASDQSDLKGTLNGYYLQFGEAGSLDAIELFRQQGSTSTSVCRGTNATIAASFEVRVKVTRDNAGNWTLAVDHTGGSTFVTEATGTDNSINASSWFGVLCNYTVSNANKFFFDDVYAGPLVVDITPPAIVSATAVSATQLDVLFNEPVDQVTAETASNYSVNNGIGSPVTATRDAGNLQLVHLTFASGFPSGNHQLTVNAVEDLNGNTLNNGTANFSWSPAGTAAYRSVVINEFMADPSPQVALPATEFIELFNADTIAVNLGGWTISDGSSTATLPSYMIAPGAYVMITAHADTSAFSPVGTVLGVSSFPSLNNSGDSIFLRNGSSQIIDALGYDLSWYQDGLKDDGGWTLEQKNPFLPCSGSQNWSASIHPNGGTPGQQNSVFSNQPDVLSPQILNAIPVSSTLLQVTFTETMDVSTLQNAGYSISGGISVSQVQIVPGGDGVTLTLSPALTPGQSYEISISGATDCAGNILSPSTSEFGIGVAPGVRDIIITEFFPDPDGSTSLPEAEFVEIHNTGSLVISLSGLTLSDGSSTAAFPAENILPGGYIIVTAAASAGFYNSYGRVVSLPTLPSLNNTGDKIILKNASGLVLHQVQYNSSWYGDAQKDDGGWTLEMIDPSNPCGGLLNWKASESPAGGTPGQTNSVNGANPDNVAPAFRKAVAVSPDTIYVWFSEYLDSTVISSANYSVSNGITVTEVIWSSTGTVKLVVAGSLQENSLYVLTGGIFTDCAGNQTSSAEIEFVLPVSGAPGDLIINEVLFNPRTGGSDFVEIYNFSEKYINLNGWGLANFEDDTVSNVKILTSEPTIIMPGRFLVITKDSNNILMEYPLSSGNMLPGSFLQLSSLPSYNNDQGTVILLNSEGVISDRFDYTDDMHFALLDDVKGVSLERIRYDVPSGESSNWHSASHQVGYATPGYKNSQAAGSGQNNAEIRTEPEIFSPDNDGYQDVLTIFYSFSEPGMVATVSVYNDRGYPVRKLIENQLLGSDGAITWDGVKDNGEKAPVGIYIILFESFRTDGSVVRKKLPVVVAARL